MSASLGKSSGTWVSPRFEQSTALASHWQSLEQVVKVGTAEDEESLFAVTLGSSRWPPLTTCSMSRTKIQRKRKARILSVSTKRCHHNSCRSVGDKEAEGSVVVQCGWCSTAIGGWQPSLVQQHSSAANGYWVDSALYNPRVFLSPDHNALF